MSDWLLWKEEKRWKTEIRVWVNADLLGRRERLALKAERADHLDQREIVARINRMKHPEAWLEIISSNWGLVLRVGPRLGAYGVSERLTTHVGWAGAQPELWQAHRDCPEALMLALLL